MWCLSVHVGLLGIAYGAAVSFPPSTGPLASQYGRHLVFPWLVFLLYRMLFGPPQMPGDILVYVGKLLVHAIKTNIFALVLGAAAEKVVIYDEQHPHFNALVHAGLAYTFCGMLNAITLNVSSQVWDVPCCPNLSADMSFLQRQDMDPGSVALLLQGPRMEYSTVPEKGLGQCVKERICSYVCFILIFYILIRVIEDTIEHVYGMDVSFWTFSQEKVRPQDGIFIIYALGALADIAETVRYKYTHLILKTRG